MKSLPLFSVFLFCFITSRFSVLAQSAHYFVSFPQPASHYVQVRVVFDQIQTPVVEVKLPVWIPGSYMIREFSRHIEKFNVIAKGGQQLLVSKTKKNVWSVEIPENIWKNKGQIEVSYLLYCNDLTVRTNHIDLSHAYLNGAASFVYTESSRNAVCRLSVDPAGWKSVDCGLERIDKLGDFDFVAANYDELADSPMEIGNSKILRFKVNKIDHKIVFYGQAAFEDKQIIKDFKKICTAATSIIGEHPCKNYTFIVHNLAFGGGGLEHSNSTSLQVNQNDYASPQGYLGIMGLVAHEYFHLWNVKRIRPKELGPFDYEQENYTSMLWVAEGFTSYYDDFIVYKAGMIDSERFLAYLASNMSATTNTPGSKVQSLSEASFDAWIKHYRPNENSNNSTISYYTKGAVVASFLDLEIMHRTSGTKNLDDVMRLLWSKYYKQQNRGFSEAELIEAIEQVAGASFKEIIQSYVHTTSPLDYQKYLEYAGLQIKDLNAEKNVVWLGINTSVRNGRTFISSIVRDSPAYSSGLSPEDEIILVDQNKITTPLADVLAAKGINQNIEIQIGRAGSGTLSFNLKTVRNPAVVYQIRPKEQASELQKAVYKKWMAR